MNEQEYIATCIAEEKDAFSLATGEMPQSHPYTDEELTDHFRAQWKIVTAHPEQV